MFSFSGVAFGLGGPVGVANVLVDFGSFFCGHVDRALGCIGPLPWSVLPYAVLCNLKKKKKKKKYRLLARYWLLRVKEKYKFVRTKPADISAVNARYWVQD